EALGDEDRERSAAISPQQVSVEIERRVRDASRRGATDPREEPGRAAATTSVLEPGGQRELNAAAAHRALALPQTRESRRKVLLHRVVGRVRLEAVQFVRIAR